MKQLISILIVISMVLSSCTTKVSETSYTKKRNWEYYYKLGLSYISSGNNSKALSYLSKAYELNPKNADILNALGITYAAVGNLEKAEQMFLKAISVDPNKAETYTNLGALYAQMQKYQKAIDYLKKAAGIVSYYEKEKAYYNLALVYKKIGNLKKYEEYMNKAISYKVTFTPAYISLSNFYISRGEMDKAKDVLTRALNYGISDPYIYLNLGKVYYAYGNIEQAKKYLKKAYKLSDNSFIREEAKKLLGYIALNKPYPAPVKKEVLKERLKNSYVLTEKEENTENEEKKEEVSQIDEITKKQEEPKKEKSNFKFFIQVGVFSSKEKADTFSNQLVLNGLKPELKERTIAGKVYYYVIIGYFKNYLEAYEFLNEKLKKKGINGIIKFERL